MQERMKNPAVVIPEAMQPIQALYAAGKGGVPRRTLELVHLRASQINGCSFCVDSGSRSALKAVIIKYLVRSETADVLVIACACNSNHPSTDRRGSLYRRCADAS